MKFWLSLQLLCAVTLLPLIQAAAILPLVAREGTDQCTQPPRDSCAFYTDCLEAQVQCGPSGYPLYYGARICKDFGEQRRKLSPRGQKWMVDVMQCLQGALIPEATGAVHLSCDQLEEKAFASHPKCYIDSGLCTLPVSDWVAIGSIVKLSTLFSNWDIFMATVQSAVGCTQFYLYLLTHAL